MTTKPKTRPKRKAKRLVKARPRITPGRSSEVERRPEEAGAGGSIPSVPTIPSEDHSNPTSGSFPVAAVPVFFRPHRIGLTVEQSTALAVPMPTRAALAEHLRVEGAELHDITPYGLDARNGWYHHTVRGRRADGSLVTVGFTNGPLA